MTHKERMRMNKIRYAFATGSIVYVMLCTRPILSHTECHEQIPNKSRGGSLDNYKDILKYLKRTKDVFLVYGGAELQVKGYANASFQIDRDDSKSQSGYIFTLNNGAQSVGKVPSKLRL